MKAIIRIAFLLFLTCELFAQSPNQINFQGVLRNTDGTPLKNQTVTITASFTTFNVGTLRYRETHAVSTDDFGLIHLTLGTGNPVSGLFQNIQWDQEQISFSAEAALAGGVTINIQELKFVSVPYALHANTATTLSGPNDTDNTNELNQSLTLNGTTLQLTDAGGERSVDLSAFDQDAEHVAFRNSETTLIATNVQTAIQELSTSLATVNTDEQTLAFDGTSISITGGNSIDISSLEEDADSNPENELNLNFELTGTTLKMVDAGGELTVDLASTNQNAAQVPYDNTGTDIAATDVQGAINELANDIAVVNTDGQTLSFDGTSLSITGGNNVNLSALQNDADASTTNEIQHLSLTGSTLSLSNSDTQINLTGLEADDQNASQVPYTNSGTQLTATDVQGAINQLAGALTTVDTDNQQLSFDGTSISIADGNTVDLSALKDDSDASTTNEIQHLSINGTTISLSGSGAQVNLTGLGIEADDQNASQVPYTNAGTQLTSTNVQTALTEIANALTTLDTDDQDLSFNGTSLSIEDGNSVDLSALEDDADANPTNEIQHLSVTGSTISLSGSVQTVNLTGIGVEADDQNASQVPFDGTGANMDATEVQSAIVELAAEKVRNLQEAYAANSLITLDGTNPLMVNNNSGAPLLTASNNGQVGIGTSTPDATLDVGSSGPDVHAQIEVSNSDGSHRLNLFSGRTSSSPFISVFPNDALRFAHYNGTTLSERMRIAPDGSVGIGTIQPQSRVHVTGTTTNVTGPLDTFETGFGLTTEAGTIFEFSRGSDQTQASSIAAVMTSNSGTGNAILAHSNGPDGATNRGVYAAASGGNINYGATGNAFQSASENIGLRGIAQQASSFNIGVHATALGIAGSTNFGGSFSASGLGTTNYGIYASAGGATTNWAGWFQGSVRVQGNLSVNGQFTLNGKSLSGTSVGNSNYVVGNGLGSITSGQNNFGAVNALAALTTGNDNVAMGSGTLSNLTTGSGNIAFGRYTMTAATGGEHNIAMGTEVLRNNTTGQRNIGMGYLQLRQNTTGSNNVALGAFALDNNTTGSGNVALGEFAGSAIVNSNNDTLLGTHTNISNNASRAVGLGYNANPAQDDAIILGDANNAAVRVGIGINAPSHKLHVVGDALVTGTVTASNVANPSDARLKTNIAPIEDALSLISKLDGVSYFWKKDDPESAKKQFGLIAQELEKVIPDLVQTNADGFKSVNYISLIPFLLESLKQQQAEIESLKSENTTLKSTLESKVDALTALVKSFEASLNAASQQTTTGDEKK